MNRLNGLEKIMKKIEKNDDKTVKILNKQKKELLKALEENEKLIQQRLGKSAPTEIKLDLELERLTKRLSVIKDELDKIRAKKQDEVMPLHVRSMDLQERLRNLDTQLNSMSNSSNSNLSRSTFDLNFLSEKKGNDLDAEFSANPPYNPDYPPPYPE
eukprot:TRINITY_DN18870_c0_g1_i1.p2 TRINITY_DN18870_c0_g1~~TRINITY_DN18870_c0_g1_i1.p2  ORF type:complete len:157 (-),score=45.88 TRINITY_DN18870_c0_g1_i1:1504-1974(-)